MMTTTIAAASTRREGFTLLEVIVALAILTVGISSAIALFAAATAMHKRAVDRIHAAAIAEHALADIESALARGADPEALVANPPFEAIRTNWPGYEVTLGIHNVLIVAEGEEEPEAEGDELMLELRVQWKAEGQTRSQVFRQLVAREEIFR